MSIFVQPKNGIVVNRSEFADGVPEGWPEAETWHASETAQIGWLYDGEQFIPPSPPSPPPVTSFLARDLLALLTADDLAAIKAAVDADAELYGLWCATLAQGEAPISIESARFQAGWAGLTTALGEERAGELAAALNLDLS